ncbi:MAG: putative endolysin [Prokaryotic dsDNA virus sp.]|nr:MAG: putative endolysin [Prokaryotic dsDNA virus sp.]|tara:strand:+ start:8934 stop:9341 length:408 start_codon:yes stop_codon:yes gene_type:complete
MSKLLERIKHHEGFRSRVYKCTEGYDTIGYGFAIKDLEMDEDIAELILMKKLDDLMNRIMKTFHWWRSAEDNVKDVVIEMCYQLGVRGFSKFKKTIDHLENKRYAKASVEMLDSKWARQTPNRALELSNIIKNLE